MLWDNATFIAGILGKDVSAECRKVHGGLERWRRMVLEVVRAYGCSRRRSARSGGVRVGCVVIEL